MRCYSCAFLLTFSLSWGGCGTAAPKPASGASPAARPAAPAAADRTSTAPAPVEMALISDTSHVSAGQEATLAVHMRVADGWRILWTNPGDRGAGSSVELTAPEGFDLSGLRWPAPERFEDAEGTVQFGYRGDVLVPAAVVAPDGLSMEAAQFSASASWMACRDSCIEGTTTADLALPRASPDAPSAPTNEALFRTAAKRLPLSLADDEKLSHEWSQNGAQRTLIIRISDAREIEYYPSIDEAKRLVGAAVIPDRDAQVLRITFQDQGEPPARRGVVAVASESNSEVRYLSLDVDWSQI